jgi:hypothetical protein
MTGLERVAGVEQSPSQVPALPPPHSYPDRAGVGVAAEPEAEPRAAAADTARRAEQASTPALPPYPPALTAAQAFGAHFFRCFFCRIGDNRIEDHFCETGRELIVAMLDEMDGRP